MKTILAPKHTRHNPNVARWFGKVAHELRSITLTNPLLSTGGQNKLCRRIAYRLSYLTSSRQILRRLAVRPMDSGRSTSKTHDVARNTDTPGERTVAVHFQKNSQERHSPTYCPRISSRGFISHYPRSLSSTGLGGHPFLDSTTSRSRGYVAVSRRLERHEIEIQARAITDKNGNTAQASYAFSRWRCRFQILTDDNA